MNDITKVSENCVRKIFDDRAISQCDVLSAALVFPKGLPQRVGPHI